MPDVMGAPVEIHLTLPSGDMRVNRNNRGSKMIVLNVIRIPGLKRGKRIRIDGHPTLTDEYIVSGLAPVRRPQDRAYKVKEMR